MSESIVYLNGEFLPQDQAHISVLDRGFLFADGVYEVIPAYGRRAFRMPHHLKRLHNSLTSVRIPAPLNDNQWQQVVNQLIEANDGDEQSIYLQVTRGPARRDHAFPSEIHPTVFAMSSPIKPVTESTLENGIAAITVDDIRWHRCDIKSIALLPNVLAKQSALDADADDAILIRNGIATEGAAANLFAVFDKKVITPPNSPELLPGVTRDLVLELLEAGKLDHAQEDIPESRLIQADEIWLTSSTREIVAVTQLNGQPVGNGQPGPCWRDMLDRYQAYKQQFRQGRVE